MPVNGRWTEEQVVEPARTLNVIERVDVLICGGGPAGIGAALAAARTGARTAVVERYGFLGGIWTAGMLNPILDHANKGGIVGELVDRLRAGAGASTVPAEQDLEGSASLH